MFRFLTSQVRCGPSPPSHSVIHQHIHNFTAIGALCLTLWLKIHFRQVDVHHMFSPFPASHAFHRLMPELELVLVQARVTHYLAGRGNNANVRVQVVSAPSWSQDSNDSNIMQTITISSTKYQNDDKIVSMWTGEMKFHAWNSQRIDTLEYSLVFKQGALNVSDPLLRHQKDPSFYFYRPYPWETINALFFVRTTTII